jgi:uncharacterized protein
MNVADALHPAPQLAVGDSRAQSAAGTLRALREHRQELADRFAVRSLALFGSVARGEGGAGSDVDLLVEFARPIGLLHLAETALYVEDILGRPVDLVLRRALLPELREGILAEAVDVF